MTMKALALILPLVLVVSCANAQSEVTDFASCVAAGNGVLKSLPPKCRTADGRVFTDESARKPNVPAQRPIAPDLGCKNQCGDGACAELVCMGPGCPCPETAENCPQDCSDGGKK